MDMNFAAEGRLKAFHVSVDIIGRHRALLHLDGGCAGRANLNLRQMFLFLFPCRSLHIVESMTESNEHTARLIVESDELKTAVLLVPSPDSTSTWIFTNRGKFLTVSAEQASGQTASALIVDTGIAATKAEVASETAERALVFDKQHCVLNVMDMSRTREVSRCAESWLSGS